MSAESRRRIGSGSGGSGGSGSDGSGSAGSAATMCSSTSSSNTVDDYATEQMLELRLRRGGALHNATQTELTPPNPQMDNHDDNAGGDEGVVGNPQQRGGSGAGSDFNVPPSVNVDYLDWYVPEADTRASQVQSVKEETKRLMALKSYNVLKSIDHQKEREYSLDRLATLARNMFHCKMSFISVVDLGRCLFLAQDGLPNLVEVPRRHTFCSHALLAINDYYEVKDAQLHSVFCEYDMVQAGVVRFYAAYPLICPEGYKLGLFTVVDDQPRPNGLSDIEKDNLKMLAQSAMEDLVRRRELMLARTQLQNSIRNNASLSHDLLTPLTGLQLSLTMLLDEDSSSTCITNKQQQQECLTTALECAKVMNQTCEYLRGQSTSKTSSGVVGGSPSGGGDASGSTNNKRESGGCGDDYDDTSTASTTSGQDQDDDNDWFNLRSMADRLQMVGKFLCSSKTTVSVKVDDETISCSQVYGDETSIFRSCLNLLTYSCQRTSKTTTGAGAGDSNSIVTMDFQIRQDVNGYHELYVQCEDTGPHLDTMERNRILHRGTTISSRASASAASSSHHTNQLTLAAVANQLRSVTTDFGMMPLESVAVEGEEQEQELLQQEQEAADAASPCCCGSPNNEGTQQHERQEQEQPSSSSSSSHPTTTTTRFWFCMPVKVPSEHYSSSSSSSSSAEGDGGGIIDPMDISNAGSSNKSPKKSHFGCGPQDIRNVSQGQGQGQQHQPSQDHHQGQPQEDDQKMMISVEQVPHSNTKKQHRRTALVVEDSPVILKMLSRALENLDFEVSRAMNGLEGLEMMKGRRYDIALVDFLMPVCDGWDCCRLLREWEAVNRPSPYHQPQLVVGMSAHASEKDVARSLELGMDMYQDKPISVNDLRRLTSNLGVHQQRRHDDHHHHHHHHNNKSPGQSSSSSPVSASSASSSSTDTVSVTSVASTVSSGPGSPSLCPDSFSSEQQQQRACLLVGSRSELSSLEAMVKEAGCSAVIAESTEHGMQLLKSRNWRVVVIDNGCCRQQQSGSEYVQYFRDWEQDHRVNLQRNLYLYSSGVGTTIFSSSSSSDGGRGATSTTNNVNNQNEVANPAYDTTSNSNIIASIDLPVGVNGAIQKPAKKSDVDRILLCAEKANFGDAIITR